MSTKDEDDMKHYKTGIRKWDGLRGESWRIFIRDVKAHARGRFSKDDKFNWGKVMTGIDAGGAAQGAPALPNGDAAQIKQDIRRGETYTFLYEHIACDKIKQMLQILADGPEPADGIGKAAWDLIVREGQEDENDLELEDLNEAWEAMSIMNTVGIRLTSVNDFRRSIDIMDGKRPAMHKFAPQSTWEAELAAINMLLKIMRFASHLYYDMTKKKLPTPWLFTDSKSAFDTIKNPGATKRSNHLERWLHFARELYLRNAIRYGLVPTHLMMADNLTKVADREKFFTCIQYQMGM
jgi:hypothetical protein